MHKVSHKILVLSTATLGALWLITAALGLYAVAFYIPRFEQNLLAQVAVVKGQEVKVAATIAANGTYTQKQVAQVASVTKKSGLAPIVSEWSPRVPLLSCTFDPAVSNGESLTGSGVAVVQTAESINIWTNKHVLSQHDISAVTCSVSFLDGSTYTIAGGDFVIDKGTDFAYLSLYNPEALQYGMKESRLCRTAAQIGDKIVVLGYPTIGAQQGITATEGIISGIEGDYYVTSAKIESGNSGGIVVNVEDNCYLGIPTFVKIGSLESLARVLKWQVYQSFATSAR